MFFAGLLVIGAAFADRQFISRHDSFTGTWEYGGNASLSDAGLAIPRDSIGFAWFSRQLPSQKWKVNATVHLENTADFALWFTDNFGLTGESFGGPHLFKGVAVLVRYNGTTISLEIRENDGKEEFKPSQFFPRYECTPKQAKFVIECFFFNHTLNISFGVDGRSELVFSEKLRVALRKPWLGFTAKTQSQVTLESVRVKGPKKMKKFTKPENETHHESQFLTEMKDKNAKVGVIDVIKCVDELVTRVDPVADSAYVEKYVRDSLVEFADKWQRRSLNIVTETSELRVQLEFELNTTRDAIEDLKYDVDRVFKKMKKDVHDIESELYFGVLKGYDLDHNIRKTKKELKKSWLIPGLLAVSICETIVAFGFVVCHCRDAE